MCLQPAVVQSERSIQEMKMSTGSSGLDLFLKKTGKIYLFFYLRTRGDRK